jgi:hypothetical protein
VRFGRRETDPESELVIGLQISGLDRWFVTNGVTAGPSVRLR